MTIAAFVGDLGALAKAYPAELRKELEKAYAFPFSDQTKDSSQTADFSQVEIIFSTWGMRPLDADFLKAAPELRAVFYAAGSVKSFATDEAYARGVTICGAWRANAIPVAEYTISTIILSLKKFWHASRPEVGRVSKPGKLAIPGAYRRKVGLLSLGAIGFRVAEMLKVFELEILACDPFCDPRLAQDAGVKLVSIETLFQECEVISIHTPLLPQTRKLVSATLVASMRDKATLINTARGAVLDEDAVLEVLRERSDLTAILDVAIQEPPSADSLIFQLKNVIYTPHIAGSHGSEIARMGTWMADEARRFLAGEPLQHAITADMLDKVA